MKAKKHGGHEPVSYLYTPPWCSIQPNFGLRATYVNFSEDGNTYFRRGIYLHLPVPFANWNLMSTVARDAYGKMYATKSKVKVLRVTTL